jgi:hypothetical protein
VSSENDDQTVGGGSGGAQPDHETSGAPELSAFDALLISASSQPVPDDATSESGQSSPADSSDRGEPDRALPFDFSERPQQSTPKAGLSDWMSLVLAVVLPPLGLLASIVVRIVSYRSKGWTSKVARAATIVGVIMTLVAGGGLFAVNMIVEQEAAEQARVAASVPLCLALGETPGVLDEPAFGWPLEVAALPETLELMKSYQAQWTALSALAPVDQVSAVRSVAVAAQTLVSSVETTTSIDRQRNLEQMTKITRQAGLNSWHSNYCS